MSTYGKRVRQLLRAEIRLEDSYSSETESVTGSPFSRSSLVCEVNGVSLTVTPGRRRGWFCGSGMLGTPWALVEFYAGERFLVEDCRSGDYPVGAGDRRTHP